MTKKQPKDQDFEKWVSRTTTVDEMKRNQSSDLPVLNVVLFLVDDVITVPIVTCCDWFIAADIWIANVRHFAPITSVVLEKHHHTQMMVDVLQTQ